MYIGCLKTSSQVLILSMQASLASSVSGIGKTATAANVAA